MNENELNNLINSVSKATGKSTNDVKSASNNSDVQQLLNKLNPNDAQKLQDILADPKATEKVLATPRAQAIMEKLFGKK